MTRLKKYRGCQCFCKAVYIQDIMLLSAWVCMHIFYYLSFYETVCHLHNCRHFGKLRFLPTVLHVADWELRLSAHSKNENLRFKSQVVTHICFMQLLRYLATQYLILSIIYFVSLHSYTALRLRMTHCDGQVYQNASCQPLSSRTEASLFIWGQSVSFWE